MVHNRVLLLIVLLSLVVPAKISPNAQAQSLPATFEIRLTALDPLLNEGDPCVGRNELNSPIRLVITGASVDDPNGMAYRLFGRIYLVDGVLLCSTFVMTDLPLGDSYELRFPDINGSSGIVKRIYRAEIEKGPVLVELPVVAVRASPYANHLRLSLPDATSLFVTEMLKDPGDDLYVITFVEYGFADDVRANRAFAYIDEFYNQRSAAFLLDQGSNLQSFDIGEPGDERVAYTQVFSDGRIYVVIVVRYGNRILEISMVTDQPDISTFMQTFAVSYAAAIDASTVSLLPQQDDVPEGWLMFGDPDDGFLERYQVIPPPIPVGTPVST